MNGDDLRRDPLRVRKAALEMGHGTGRRKKSRRSRRLEVRSRFRIGFRCVSALSVIPAWESAASYSTGRDIGPESEPSTGTKLDIAATDHIKPIAITTAIPTIHTRICIPSTSR